MAVNKIIYGGKTLVDLTSDTVTAADLADGVKATGADGKPIVGLLPKVTIDSQLSASSTNPVQNKVINEKFNSILLPNGQLSTPSSNDAYLCKVAADALSSINDITQMTIEQSADGKIWETVFDSDSTSASIKQAYLYGLRLPKTITIPSGYMARVTLATHTTTYFSNISLFLVARSPSANTLSYKCSVGFNELQHVVVQDTISTWGSWAASLFDIVGYNIVQYIFNEDKKADSSLSFMGMQCKGTNPFRNVLRFDDAKQITTTPFGIQAPTFNGYTIEASVPANAKFTDTVYTHPPTHPADMITGLSTVATSGSYNDLSNKPAVVKSVNNVTPDSNGNVNISVSGSGVSTDTANIWTAMQTFGDVVFGGVEKCYWEFFNSNSAKPTKTHILIFPSTSVFTLDMSELVKQTSSDWSNAVRFKIFINNTTSNSYTLKIDGITNLYTNNVSISDQMILDGIIWGGNDLPYGYISATSLSMKFTGGIS